MLILLAFTLLASLNRETGILLPLCYAAYHVANWRTRAYWLRCGTLVAVWGVVTLGLHLWLGSAPHVLGIAGTFSYNMDTIGEAVVSNVPVVALALVVAVNLRRKPRAVQALAAVAGVYTLTVIGGGAWQEVRLMLPALVLVMPVIFSH